MILRRLALLLRQRLELSGVQPSMKQAQQRTCPGCCCCLDGVSLSAASSRMTAPPTRAPCTKENELRPGTVMVPDGEVGSAGQGRKGGSQRGQSAAAAVKKCSQRSQSRCNPPKRWLLPLVLALKCSPLAPSRPPSRMPVASPLSSPSRKLCSMRCGGGGADRGAHSTEVRRPQLAQGCAVLRAATRQPEQHTHAHLQPPAANLCQVLGTLNQVAAAAGRCCSCVCWRRRGDCWHERQCGGNQRVAPARCAVLQLLLLALTAGEGLAGCCRLMAAANRRSRGCAAVASAVHAPTRLAPLRMAMLLGRPAQ